LTDGIIEEIHFEDAQEFFDFLRPENPTKEPDHDIYEELACLVNPIHRNQESNFISPLFRGQCNSEWELEPSCFRSSFENIYADHPGWAALRESRLLDDFYKACDTTGLMIPGDSSKYEGFLNTITSLDRSFFGTTWPPTELREFIALAQHHGVPTRLLDWTKRAHIAIYFAASSAIRQEISNSQQLAVWVLSSKIKEYYQEIDLEIIKVPGSTSQNLAAQSGLFTLLSTRDQEIGNKEFENLNRVLANNKPTVDRVFSTLLFKVTTPAENSVALLKLCTLYGISASALFPGYDGAAKEALDKSNIEWHSPRR